MDEKFEHSEFFEEVKVGQDFPIHKPSKNVSKKVSANVLLTFKENRAYELHLNRKIWRFAGRETLSIPRALLEDKNFTEAIRDKFIITEEV